MKSKEGRAYEGFKDHERARHASFLMKTLPAPMDQARQRHKVHCTTRKGCAMQGRSKGGKGLRESILHQSATKDVVESENSLGHQSQLLHQAAVNKKRAFSAA